MSGQMAIKNNEHIYIVVGRVSASPRAALVLAFLFWKENTLN